LASGQARPRATPGATAGATTRPQGPGRLVVFNFDNADIEIVLQATSELLVFNYVLSPEVRGKKVTVQTTGRIPVDDIFPVPAHDPRRQRPRRRQVGQRLPDHRQARGAADADPHDRGRRGRPGSPRRRGGDRHRGAQVRQRAGRGGPAAAFVPAQAALTSHRDTNLS